ncbi:MAG TPA: aminotransferase class IV [Solirubrobacterales bacterium]|jgi:para-aminobenzoate synthetase/4-amino-4-deoxychorismate lyase
MTGDHKPDAAKGVFETLLVVEGSLVELDAHLGRLNASLVSLYGEELPAPAREAVGERAAGISLGRLRLTVAPGPDGLDWEAVAAEIDPAIQFPGHEQGAELRTLLVPGGLGCHKWADRLLPTGDDGALSLLVDQGGEVLETGRANVFAATAGQLTTPAADGRILPGITRDAVIELARSDGIEVLQRSLTLDQLLAAEEVFLTNSVRGIEPVRSLDGSPLRAEGDFGQRLGERLRERWAADRQPVPAGSA